MRYVMVPGIGGSGVDHWQSLWEAEFGADATRIAPASWDEPDLADWFAALDAAASPDAVIVAHSLGCLAAALWLLEHPAGAAGAFLVAPPDPASPAFPKHAAQFTAAEGPLPVPALVVASTNDGYSSIEAVRTNCRRWRAAMVELGGRGHVNSASGVGAWPEGRHLLTAFTAGLFRPARDR